MFAVKKGGRGEEERGRVKKTVPQLPIFVLLHFWSDEFMCAPPTRGPDRSLSRWRLPYPLKSCYYSSPAWFPCIGTSVGGPAVPTRPWKMSVIHLQTSQSPKTHRMLFSQGSSSSTVPRKWEGWPRWPSNILLVSSQVPLSESLSKSLWHSSGGRVRPLVYENLFISH